MSTIDEEISSDFNETFLRSLDDHDGIRECYTKYGAVGITGVLTKQECDETITDVQNILIKLSGDRSFDINNPDTFENVDRIINRYGVIGKTALFTKILNRNRFHKNVKKAYSIVYDLPENQLLAQFDRVGWMRPTVSYKSGIAEKIHKYVTPLDPPGLHLDVDPEYYFDSTKLKDVRTWLNGLSYDSDRFFVAENNGRNIEMGTQCQGVLNLMDNEKNDGGFQFIPKGVEMCRAWYNRNEKRIPKGAPSGRYMFTKEDYEFVSPVRLPCPAGTLIVFSCGMPHGTRPNDSDKSRMVQFLRYMPRSLLSKQTQEKRKDLIKSACKTHHVVLEEKDVI
jgi:hypothetical protein